MKVSCSRISQNLETRILNDNNRNAISQIQPQVAQNSDADETTNHGGDGPNILPPPLRLSSIGVKLGEPTLWRIALRASVV